MYFVIFQSGNIFPGKRRLRQRQGLNKFYYGQWKEIQGRFELRTFSPEAER
jgi:hypothetical protein